MDDGLEWQLKLDADTGGATTFMSKLDAMDAKLRNIDSKLGLTSKASDHAGDAHRRHAKDVEHLGGAFDKLIHQGFEPFLQKAESIAEFEFVREGVERLLELPGELAEKVKDLGDEALRSASKAERMEASFALAMGKNQSEETLKFINFFAKRSEFTVEQLEEVGSELAKVGYKGEGLNRAIRAAADMAAFDHSGVEGLHAAVFGLEQVKRTGEVTDRTLRGLALGKNDFFEALSERTGESTKTLKAKMDAGKLNVEDSIETLNNMITKKTGKGLGGAAMDMGDLMGAKLAHLGEIPELLTKEMSKTQGFDKIKGFVTKLEAGLDPSSEVGGDLHKSLEAAFLAVGTTLEKFDLKGTLKTVGDVLHDMPGEIRDATKAFDGMGIVLKNVEGSAFAMLHDMEGVAHIVAKMTGVQDHIEPDHSLLGKVTTKGGWVDRAIHAPDKASAWVGRKLFGWGEDAGSSAADGMAKGLKGGEPDVHDQADHLGGAGEKGLKGKLEVHSPSKLFDRIGQMTADGFVDGLSDGIHDVDRAMDRMVKVPRVDSEMFDLTAPLPHAIRSSSVGASGFHAGGITVTNTIHITGVAGAPGEVGEAIAARLDAILPSQLQSAVERICIGMGGDLTGSS